MNVDVMNFSLRAIRVPMQQDANTGHQRSGHLDFIAAKKRNIQPSHLPSGKRRELGVQVASDREYRTRDVLGLDPISAND